MKKKNYLVPYFILPFTPILFAFAFEFITDSGQLTLLEYPADYSIMYAIRIATILITLASLVSVFTWMKNRPDLIITALVKSATMVLFDYYINLGNPESNNLLWLLPMISIVYIAKYKSIANAGDAPTGTTDTSNYSK